MAATAPAPTIRNTYVRKRQSMSMTQMLPVGWLSNSLQMSCAIKSISLSGSLGMSNKVVEKEKSSTTVVDQQVLIKSDIVKSSETLEEQSELLEVSSNSNSVTNNEKDNTLANQPIPREKEQTNTVLYKRLSSQLIDPSTQNVKRISHMQDIEQQQRILEMQEDLTRHKILDFAVQRWRQSRPDVVLLSPLQTKHRCEARLTLVIRRPEDNKDIRRKNAPLRKSSTVLQQIESANLIPCQLTKLTITAYRNGHYCVLDNDRRARLCLEPQNTALHSKNLELWRDETIYMCNTSGWAHRCGKYCQASVMVSTTQYCYTCPITGLADTSRCLEVSSFWTPENETQGATDSSSSGSSGNGGNGNGSGSGSGGGGSGSSSSSVPSAEDSRLRQMFTRDGSMRRHGETLMHQLNYSSICTDWVQQLTVCKNREEIENFSQEYIRATMRVNRPLGYLMVAMCDLWLLLCPARRELEIKRQYHVHAAACAHALRLQNEYERLFKISSPGTIAPYSLINSTIHYYAHVARFCFPILPALDACVSFLVAHSHALVQLWYVMHTRALPTNTNPKSQNGDAVVQSRDRRHPPKDAIAFAKFVLPALRVLSRGVIRAALFEGELDQVLIAPQQGLLLILPEASVLQSLCNITDINSRTLSSTIERALIDGVRSGRCTVENLDFTQVSFECMDHSLFYSLDLREKIALPSRSSSEIPS